MLNNNKPRILFLGGGPFFPDSIPNLEKFQALSEYFDGEILTPMIGSTGIDRLGNFRLNTYTYVQNSSILRNAYAFASIVFRGLGISLRRGRFDVIISPNPLSTGLAGLLLARLSGARSVIEVNGNFESAFKFGREGQSEVTWMDRLKERVSKVIIPFSLRRASVVKLVYRHQLDPLGIGQGRIRTVSFPNFVPIRRFIEAAHGDRHYILLMGFPWYLKGVDLLIRAFRRISDEFPDYRLKVVGWCPEGREYFEDLAAGNPKIELLDPVEYDGVIELMANCSLYVLASRTDSSPRVLREAMASRKPIIASNTDGVPDLITDGYNGLLFENGNVDDLEKKMRMVLGDAKLAERLADNGYSHVQEQLSEKVYADRYRELIESVCGHR